MPRATPVRWVVVPYSSGAAGGVKVIAPIVNHVERRPITARAVEPLIVFVPFVPTSVSVRTRPEGAASVRTSSRVPRAPSFLPSCAAPNWIGPQLWYGDSVSYGSGTETRYGSGFEPVQTSCTFAVLPPELEKKNVSATSPS